LSGFFSSQISARNKKAGLILIKHLQKMFAYQQLSMERYNDALAFAARIDTPTNEFLSPRQSVTLFDVSAVREYVLPALQMKFQTLQIMENEHRNIEQTTSNILKPVYTDFSQQLTAMQKRTRLQYECFSAWIQDQTRSLDTTQVDETERQAMDRTCISLNELINKVGLDVDAWLDVVCDAHNAVRETIGISPMKAQEFREIYFSGLAGKPARFFAR
jgi:hypothetical protein